MRRTQLLLGVFLGLLLGIGVTMLSQQLRTPAPSNARAPRRAPAAPALPVAIADDPQGLPPGMQLHMFVEPPKLVPNPGDQRPPGIPPDAVPYRSNGVNVYILPLQTARG